MISCMTTSGRLKLLAYFGFNVWYDVEVNPLRITMSFHHNEHPQHTVTLSFSEVRDDVTIPSFLIEQQPVMALRVAAYKKGFSELNKLYHLVDRALKENYFTPTTPTKDEP